MSAAIVMTTVSTPEDAERLGQELVAERLAACVQEVSINSRYRWEGSVHCDPEILLLIKTAEERADDVVDFVSGAHPYDVPEILTIQAGGSAAYLGWLSTETGA